MPLRAPNLWPASQIGTLPPLIQLTAYQENRGLYWFEREDLKQAANSAQC
jgi:hypothetical protein